MMIMPGNNLSGINHYFAGKYPGRFGILNTPFSWKNPPHYIPFALDNGCFKVWDENKFFSMLRKTKTLKLNPLFVVCPDVVCDAEETLRRWHKYNKKIDFPLAFACQDGMEPKDVPPEAHYCFIGGSTEFKLNNADKFKGVAPFLHIGRVNTKKRLEWAESIGANSVDGTGWFRGRGKQYNDYIEWFERGGITMQETCGNCHYFYIPCLEKWCGPILHRPL